MEKKILVVLYSYTGTGKTLAQLLTSQQGWPMGHVSEAKPRKGVWGTWRCLLDSWLRRRPEVHYVGPSPNEFDCVVLVFPIWMYRLAGPMRSFVVSHQKLLPDLAVISLMGKRGGHNAVAEIESLVGRSPLLTTVFTAAEVQNGSYAGRLQAFGDAIEQAENSQEVTRPSMWSMPTL